MEMANFNFKVSVDLHRAFKRVCLDVDKPMTQVFLELIEDFVARHAKKKT